MKFENWCILRVILTLHPPNFAAMLKKYQNVEDLRLLIKSGFCLYQVCSCCFAIWSSALTFSDLMDLLLKHTNLERLLPGNLNSQFDNYSNGVRAKYIVFCKDFYTVKQQTSLHTT